MKYKTLVHPDPVLLKIPPRLILFKSRLAAFLKLSATADYYYFLFKGKKEGKKQNLPGVLLIKVSKALRNKGSLGKCFKA